MLYSPSKSLQFGGVKNGGLEVVQTPPNPSKPVQIPPNPSPSFLKKFLNKIIKLLSLPPSTLLPLFFLTSKQAIKLAKDVRECGATFESDSKLVCMACMALQGTYYAQTMPHPSTIILFFSSL